VLAQFPPRMLLTAAVLAALTASTSTVLSLPTPGTPPVLPASLPPDPDPVVAEAPVAPQAPPRRAETQADGAARAEPADPPAQRGAAPKPEASPQQQGLTEADWARLPPNLRERVRAACAAGYLSGPHCRDA